MKNYNSSGIEILFQNPIASLVISIVAFIVGYLFFKSGFKPDILKENSNFSSLLNGVSLFLLSLFFLINAILVGLFNISFF